MADTDVDYFWTVCGSIPECILLAKHGFAVRAYTARSTADRDANVLWLDIERAHIKNIRQASDDVSVIYCDVWSGAYFALDCALNEDTSAAQPRQPNAINGSGRQVGGARGAVRVRAEPRTARVWEARDDGIIEALARLTNPAATERRALGFRLN